MCKVLDNGKKDMTDTCGFKYDEYWAMANMHKSLSQEEWKKWYSENCGKCCYMGEICMYGEE